MKVLILKYSEPDDSYGYEQITDVISVPDDFNLTNASNEHFKICKDRLKQLKSDPNNLTNKKAIKSSVMKQHVKDCGTFADFLVSKGYERLDYIEC